MKVESKWTASLFFTNTLLKHGDHKGQIPRKRDRSLWMQMKLLYSNSILDNLKPGKSQGSWKGWLLTPSIWCYQLGNVTSFVLHTWEQGIPFELVISVFCSSKWRQLIAHRWLKSKNKGFLYYVQWCFLAKLICLSFHSIRWKRWVRKTIGSSKVVQRVS